MNSLFWTIVPFGVLLVATAILCIIWKKRETPNGILRFMAILSNVLCHLYLAVAGLVWGYILLLGWWGHGWAIAAYVIFWLLPWVGGVQPLKMFLIFPIQSAKNFVNVKLEGWGFMKLEGLAGNSIFACVGKEERKAFADMISQIKPQLRDQVKNPIRRWFMLHWRWYDPLVGGYCCFDKSMAFKLDSIIHNDYGFPITRHVTLSAPTPFAGTAITEVNG